MKFIQCIYFLQIQAWNRPLGNYCKRIEDYVYIRNGLQNELQFPNQLVQWLFQRHKLVLVRNLKTRPFGDIQF